MKKQLIGVTILLLALSITASTYADHTPTITMTPTWDMTNPTLTPTPTIKPIWFNALKDASKEAYTKNYVIRSVPAPATLYKNKSVYDERAHYKFIHYRNEIYYYVLEYAKLKGWTVNETLERLQTRYQWEKLYTRMKNEGVIE